MRFSQTLIAALIVFVSQSVSAQVVINEIMYDLPGADTGREWVEIANTGSAPITVATSTWKFFEGNTNHGLTLFQGSVSIPAGGFAVIADNPSKFLVDWPNFSGTIFDSTFSLGNSSETVALKSSTTTVVDQVSYNSSSGAAGDGKSLQKVGVVWQALSPTPGLANPGSSASGGSQPQGSPNTATTTDNNTSANTSSPEIPSSSNGKTNWPVEPQVFSRITGPDTAIAGADIVFKGEALGKDKQPLENVRYLWNFGDGAVKEGENVMHAYNFPEEYVVILEASSGKFSSASRFKIKVVPADLVVGDAVGGFDGKVELVNNSGQELDLSWWHVSSGGKFFTLPKNTKILPHGHLPLAPAVMGFPVDDSNVSLLYPNGSVAYKFEKTNTAAPEASAVVAPVPENKAAVVSELAPTSAPPEAVPPPVIEPVSKVSVPSKILAQTASVVSAADTLGQGDESPDPPPRKHSSLWFYGLGGVIVLGLSFALYPRVVATPPPKNPADEFTIIED